MSKTVLVVDDDAHIRALARSVLEKHGYFVSEAHNGAAALYLLEDGPVELILSDVFMPDMDGIEFLQALKRLRGCPPVVSMSGGFAGMDLLPSTRLLGVTATLSKPFQVDDLVAVVHDTLAHTKGNTCMC
jgi:CheY-like chemotaxis protein